jgi:hypothetical protein
VGTERGYGEQPTRGTTAALRSGRMAILPRRPGVPPCIISGQIAASLVHADKAARVRYLEPDSTSTRLAVAPLSRDPVLRSPFPPTLLPVSDCCRIAESARKAAAS